MAPIKKITCPKLTVWQNWYTLLAAMECVKNVNIMDIRKFEIKGLIEQYDNWYLSLI
jgi:hypothetical protein